METKLNKKEFYVVKEIRENLVTVSPLESVQAEGESPKIQAANPHRLNVQIGSVVKLTVAKKNEFLMGFSVLFSPVVMAFIGYGAVHAAAVLLKKNPPEILKFLSAAATFSATAGLEFSLTRNVKSVMLPVITRV